MEDTLYRSLLNAQGFKALKEPIEEPSARLGVGEAEEKGSLKLLVEYKNKRPVAVTPMLDERAYQLTGYTAQDTLSAKDFPSSFYLGPTTGGY
ncbi:hypothetical protein D3D03_16370 [Exiguobacterium sp. RIT452]|uniref:hypothetical protein n=1 Tax=Exiguobacterium sp. RIT452 TaxID=2315552 RepID=UPI000E75E48F|nr:hypothetical protein [Exiguobacterium sp. RIT452]RJO94691.1 hypothetical protein D3D03_16370 [Exiguobacterium sp. RIT452]